MKVRMVGNWPLLVVVLILTLGMMPATHGVQALERVASPQLQQTQADLVLQVDTSDPKLNRLCVGETVLVPVGIATQSVAYPGDGEYLGLVVRNSNLDITLANSVVSAVQSSRYTEEPVRGEPFRVYVELTGEESGSSTVTIGGTFEYGIVLSMGEELRYALNGSTRPQPRSFDVRVVPCEFRVDIGSNWETSMYGAASTLLFANAHNLRLTGCSQGDICEFEPSLLAPPFLEWTTANNRIRGCLPSVVYFEGRAPRVRAQRVDQHVEVTITYWRTSPGDSNSRFYRNLCLPHFTVGSALCEERPDGVCWTRPPVADWFEPEELNPSRLRFTLEGGTIATTHRLNHSWGSATGSIIVTLTPVRLQQ